MREIMEHRAGKIFLLVLLLSIIGMFVAIGMGLMAKTILLFGFITMPLLAGIVFIIVWLIAYLIYFFRYWPYR